MFFHGGLIAATTHRRLLELLKNRIPALDGVIAGKIAEDELRKKKEAEAAACRQDNTLQRQCVRMYPGLYLDGWAYGFLGPYVYHVLARRRGADDRRQHQFSADGLHCNEQPCSGKRRSHDFRRGFIRIGSTI